MFQTPAYDIWLVMISIVVAFGAGYSALEMTGRTPLLSPVQRGVAFLAAGLVLGLGMWSNHFVGMLAYELPIRVDYDTGLILLSLGVASASSWLAFWLTLGRVRTTLRIVLAGSALAAGMLPMEYVAVAAMQLAA